MIIPDAILDQLLSGSETSTASDQGGLRDQQKKALAERALNAEMDRHLAGEAGAGNSRNGYGRRSVAADTGRTALEVPRDRRGSFDPLLIAKYQRRFPGFVDKIISMYARGMSMRGIAGHPTEERVRSMSAPPSLHAVAYPEIYTCTTHPTALRSTIEQN